MHDEGVCVYADTMMLTTSLVVVMRGEGRDQAHLTVPARTGGSILLPLHAT